MYTGIWNSRHKTFGAFTFVSFVWGSTWVISKIGVGELPVLTLSFLRNGIAGIVLVGYFWWKGHSLPTPAKLIQLFTLSILLFVINTGFSLWSLQFIPASTAAIIGCTTPILIYFIEYIQGRTIINALFITGCVLSIVGIIVLVYDGTPAFSSTYFFGIILSFVAVLSWCVGFVWMERNQLDIDRYYSFGWQLLASSILFYLIAIASDKNISLSNISATGWFTVGYLSLFGSVFAFGCFAYIVKMLPFQIVSLYVFINPVVTYSMNVLLLKHEVTVASIVGIILALAGVWIGSKSMHNSVKQKI